MKRALAMLACAAPIPLWATAAPADADVFGPIALASVGTGPGGGLVQQAEFANDAVVSGDGRYVAFDGSFAGHRGTFRRDLVTGEIATVAEGDAMLPSISADGRYVSFTTTARVDEQTDRNAAPDVYVRDMDRPSFQPCPEGWEASEGAREECSFTLASAVNGSAAGLSYAYGSEPTEPTTLGSVAAARSALSANGREVAFVTTATSNLANPERPASPGIAEPARTPAAQVALRYLDTDSTVLVSARYDRSTGTTQLNESGQPMPVPESTEGHYGAAFPSGEGKLPHFPSAYEGASLSADGSTVAWMGQQISEQAPVMAGGDLADEPAYTEPLWRRIGEGESAPTRRVTGGSDPTNPLCEASGEIRLSLPPTLSDPCQGPFDPTSNAGPSVGLWTAGTEFDYLPRLSADGRIVALLATAREIASGEELSAADHSDDLYVVDMGDGLTRVAATRRLTELAGGKSEALTGPLLDFGISPSGEEIAFSSIRTVFPLGSPTYVSTPAGLAKAVELYDVDLADDTLTRVTEGFEGQPSEAPEGASLTGSPSFSEDGNTLAFSSNSDNLVYGDGNKNSDAFVVDRRVFSTSPPVSEISAAPDNPVLVPAWQIEATALSRRDGTVLLEVLVPGQGTLRADAQGPVLVRVNARSSGRGKHKGRSSRPSRAILQTRMVASALKRPGASSLLPVTLQLERPYSLLASARGGFSATVELSFSAAGHATLHDEVAITFARSGPKRAAKRSHKTRRAPARRG